MKEYTPTTDDVRGWYYEGRHSFYSLKIDAIDAEFDRWLAALLTKVYANGYQRGREDAAEAVDDFLSPTAVTEYDGLVEDAVAAARGDGKTMSV